MAGNAEEKLREDCLAAFSEVLDIMNSILDDPKTPDITRDLLKDELAPRVVIAGVNIAHNCPSEAVKPIFNVFAQWDGTFSLGELDKTGLWGALWEARRTVVWWRAFCNRQMKEKTP